jgi:catechol 2,3-dioxygenase-like lactoylglutathione lyase family enzyme
MRASPAGARLAYPLQQSYDRQRMPSYRFTNVCPVFISPGVRRTVDFYVGALGFKFAKHFDKADTFATVYRDDIEIVIVQKRKGEVESNEARYGNGFDAYIDTDTVEAVDAVHEEYRAKGVPILSPPGMTDYGSYEFVFEDIDGRRIGVGLIKDEERYFKESNLR